MICKAIMPSHFWCFFSRVDNHPSQSRHALMDSMRNNVDDDDDVDGRNDESLLDLSSNVE